MGYTDVPMSIVTHHCDGTLYENLIVKGGPKILLNVLMKVVYQIAAGMAEMHNIGILHRDLVSNILSFLFFSFLIFFI